MRRVEPRWDSRCIFASVCESTLDEAPAAYKPIDDIIGPIAEAVDIIDVMKPIFNFKAS